MPAPAQPTPWLIALVCGLLSTVLFMLGDLAVVGADPATTLYFILNTFSPLPLLIIGFLYGYRHAYAGSAAGLLAILAIAPEKWDAAKYILLLAAPISLTCFLYYRKMVDAKGKVRLYNGVGFMRSMTAFGLFLCPVLTILYQNIAPLREKLEAFILSFYEQMEKAITLQDGASLESIITQQDFYSLALPYVAAATVLNMLMLLTLNALIAHTLVNKTGKAVRTAPKMANLYLNVRYSIAFALLFLGQLFLVDNGGNFLGGLWMILFFPLTLAGLGLIHRWMTPKKPAENSKIWLFYILFFVLLPYSLFAVSMLGLAQPLAWRKTPRGKKT